MNNFNSVLALSVFVVLLTGTVSFSYADYISPKKQLDSGVLPEDVICRDERVLVERTNGNVACVSERTAEKMKWKKIISTEILDDAKETLIDDSSTLAPNDVDSIEYDATLMSILETNLVFTNKQINSNIISELGILNYNLKWPTYEITFPRTGQIGVPFDVVYDYAYVIPDEETGSYENFNEQCLEGTFCSKQYFSSTVSRFVDVESDNLEYLSDTFDQKMIPLRNYTTYVYYPEFDNTRPLQEIFTFVINEPDDVYRIGEINVSIHQNNDDLVYFYVDENGIILFDPMMTQKKFVQSSFATSSAASAIETEMGKLRERSYDWTRTAVPAPVGLRDGPPPELYQYFAEKLLREYPDANYEELLIFHNFTQSWIDDFLSAMPELKTQAIDFLTSYIR